MPVEAGIYLVRHWTINHDANPSQLLVGNPCLRPTKFQGGADGAVSFIKIDDPAYIIFPNGKYDQ